MNSIISDELQYATKINNHSTIGYRQITPQNSTSITTNVVSSTGPSEVLISPSVLNFAQSRLHFTLTVPTLTSKYHFVHGNLLRTISRITVYDSSSNAILCDVSNFDNYSSVMSPLCTKLDEFLNKSSDITEILKGTVADASVYPLEDISRFKHLDIVSSEASGNPLGTYTGGTGDTTLRNMNAINPLFSQRVFYKNTTSGTSVLDVTIPLKSFKNTILSVDKQLYFPGNVVVQIYWAPNDSYVFGATAATDPVAGAASLSSPVNITNIRLDLAVEQNLNIISQVINTVKTEGLTFNIPYPSVVRTNITSQSIHNYSLQLTRAYGNKILAIINAPFNAGFSNSDFTGANTLSTCSDHSVGSITQYNTFLNNVAIKSPAGFTISQGQDYFGNRVYLKDSVIQSLPEYRLQNYCLIDSFFGEKSFTDLDPSMVDGLDVGSTNSTYTVSANMSQLASYNWITIIIGQKQLTINSMGSSIA